MKKKKNILPILIIVVGLLLTFRPEAFAQTSSFQQALMNENVSVGVETIDGYPQIYYIYNDIKTYITDTKHTNSDPQIDKENIVWMSQINGRWQIFFYNALTRQIISLTNSGNNVNPKINSGNVVWEGWVDGAWQIFFFNGISVQQLTDGDPSMNVFIEGDYISFARKDTFTQTWRALVYSVSRKTAHEIVSGIEAKHPIVSGSGAIYLTSKKFPLMVEDFFLLDFPAQTQNQPVTVTEEEIKEELTATPSAELDNTQTPESSSSGQLE